MGKTIDSLSPSIVKKQKYVEQLKQTYPVGGHDKEK